MKGPRSSSFTLLLLEFLVFISFISAHEFDLTANPPEYGVDCSYPIHYGIDKTKCPFFYDQYHKMIQGCYKVYSKAECDGNEADRLRMNVRQPATQHNYTEVGFKLIKTPKEVWEPILKFYQENKANAKAEKWYRGSTIVNSWESPSSMVSFENPSFRGGFAIKDQIWNAVKPIIEEWVGHQVEPTSLYGIRIYTEGSILATHVDRLPLVSSCIINVDQDVDEPWPVEVYDHKGKAYNITMEPGDMVLYESATVLHGRPFPLKGRHYSNVFVHFKPLDHDQLNEMDAQERLNKKQASSSATKEPLAIPRRHGGGLRSLFTGRTLKQNPKINLEDHSVVDTSPEAETFRRAAAKGENDALHQYLSKNPNFIHAADSNHWLALHEAIRAGHAETVKYLVESGADLGAKVKNGGAALWLAKEVLPVDHEIIEYLISEGAPNDA